MDQFKKSLLVLFGFGLSFCQAQTSSLSQELQFVTAIELPNVSGRIDHLSYDSNHQIVYVAALGNNTVEVVDLKTGKVVHTIRNLDEPQGIFFIPKSSFIVANGGNGACDVFDAGTYQKIITIKLSGDADNVRYDSTGERIYIGYGNGAIAVIDAKSWKIVADIKLTGHPESFQLDKTRQKIYVNVPHQKQIEIIDLGTQSVTGRWEITDASSNFPMSLDEIGHRLFIGCRQPTKLLIIDTLSGKTISSVDIDADVDDVFYNVFNKQIYASCGGGYVDVIKQVEPNKYENRLKLETSSGARTSILIPELNQFIVAAPSRSGRKAQLMIYRIK
ncbi:MAG TPA: hypothetical protein VGK38_05200 [Prolixibacteraceae bacterium]